MKTKEILVINELCENCYNTCKQWQSTKLVKCPNYSYKPFQQEFDFFKLRPARRRKKLKVVRKK